MWYLTQAVQVVLYWCEETMPHQSSALVLADYYAAIALFSKAF
jgi:hypothetical protein